MSHRGQAKAFWHREHLPDMIAWLEILRANEDASVVGQSKGAL